MIKSNELMIGDYVLVSGIPRKVEAITRKKIGYHINPQTDNRLHYARLHDVEPIEITKEFLKENGFYDSRPRGTLNEYGSYGEDIKYLSIFDMVDHILTTGFYREKGNGESDNIGRITLLRVFYIHNLQQMYRMWEIQKEWKL